MRIFLIGFMGSGKSTLGRQLASSINFEFIDLDDYIEKKNQYKISEIFDKWGEEKFRHLEHQALLDILQYSFVVIATGGGTPCFYNNMELMNTHGETFYFKVSPQIIAQRLQKSRKKRPLLKDKTPHELELYIENTIATRQKYYQQAKHIIEHDNIKIEHINQSLTINH